MIKKFSSVVIASLIGTLLTYLFTVIASHILSVPDYGEMSKWLTDVSYLGFFFTLGLNSSMFYFSREKVPVFIGMGVNTLVYSIMLILWLLFSFFFANNEFTYYFCLGVTIYLFSINELVRSFYQLKENFLLYNLLQIARPLFIFILFGIIFLKEQIVSVNTSFILYTTAMILFALLCWVYFFITGGKLKVNKASLYNKQYYFYGIKSVANQVLAQTMYAITIYMTSWIGSKESVAFFFVANSISKMAWVIPDSAGNILYPKFIKATTVEQSDIAKAEMFKYGQAVFLINVLILLFFLLFGKLFLRLLYSEEYMVSFFPTLILLIGNQGMVIYKLLSRWYASKNQWSYLYKGLFAGIVVNVISNYLLIPIWGTIGPAIGASLGFFACGLVVAIPLKGSIWSFYNLKSFFTSYIKHKK